MEAFCSVLNNVDGQIIGLQYQGKFSRELLEGLEDKVQYFMDHKLVLVVPIDFQTVSVLDHEHDSYPFLRLMINEDFPNLIDGRNNRLLDELSQRYKLWLGNLGSGARTNLIAVMEGCFDGLILDTAFTAGNRDKAIFQAVLNEMNKYTNNLILPGINTGRYRPVRLKHIEKLM